MSSILWIEMDNCLQKSYAYIKCSLALSLSPLKCHMHPQLQFYSKCFLWKFWGVDEKNPITNEEISKVAEEMFILRRTGNYLLYSGDLPEYLHTPQPPPLTSSGNKKSKKKPDGPMGTSPCHCCWRNGNRDFYNERPEDLFVLFDSEMPQQFCMLASLHTLSLMFFLFLSLSSVLSYWFQQ